MSRKAAAGLAVGALVVGVFGGIALASDGKPSSKATGSGPTKAVNGVPVGYERSRVGAIRAALGYEAALATRGLKEDWQRAVEAMAVPSRREHMIEAMRPGLELVRQNIGEDGFVRGAVVGYQLKAYDPGAAEVALWEVSVLGRPGRISPQSGWTTTTLRLRWVDGDWKLSEAPQGAEGPSPALRSAASAGDEIFATAGSVKQVGDVPVD